MMRSKITNGGSALQFGIAVFVVGLAWFFGLYNVLVALHFSWTELYGPFEHGYLVLAMGVWIAIQNWRRQPVTYFEPAPVALVPCAACVAVLVLMELLYLNSSRLVLLPVLFLCTVWVALGQSCARRLFWGAMFIYFALPQWWIVNSTLQAISVSAVTRILYLTGIPVLIEGDQVSIPSGTFQIAAGCSGLNYLMAGLALATFFALTRLHNWRDRLILIFSAGLASIAFNWLRVSLVILVGHASEMQHYLVRVEHHTFGWVLFLFFLMPLLWLGLRLEGAGAIQAGGADSSADSLQKVFIRFRFSSQWIFLSTAVVLLLPYAFGASEEPNVDQLVIADFPQAISGFERVPPSNASWAPRFRDADEQQVEYRSPGGSVFVYRASYRRQDRQHRLISSENDLVGAGFHIIGTADVRIVLAAVELPLTEFRGLLGNTEWLQWSWYEMGGRPARNSIGALLADLLSRLNGRRDGVAFALLADCDPDCAAAREQLERFLREAHSALQPFALVD